MPLSNLKVCLVVGFYSDTKSNDTKQGSKYILTMALYLLEPYNNINCMKNINELFRYILSVIAYVVKFISVINLMAYRPHPPCSKNKLKEIINSCRIIYDTQN